MNKITVTIQLDTCAARELISATIIEAQLVPGGNEAIINGFDLAVLCARARFKAMLEAKYAII